MDYTVHRILQANQGIFSTQGSNPGLPDCRRILYQLSHQGSPRILKCVAYAFSRGFSRPRNGTRVSCIAGGFFTSWATREALLEENKTGKQGAIPMVRGTLPTTLLGIAGWLFDALVEMNLGLSHLQAHQLTLCVEHWTGSWRNPPRRRNLLFPRDSSGSRGSEKDAVVHRKLYTERRSCTRPRSLDFLYLTPHMSS